MEFVSVVMLPVETGSLRSFSMESQEKHLGGPIYERIRCSGKIY